jgi:plastocyanin
VSDVTPAAPSRHGRILRPLAPVAFAALAALATVGGLACGASEPAEVAQTGAGTVVEVIAVDNTFKPEVIEVEPGTEVVWVNRGRSNHDVVPTDASDTKDWGIALGEFTPGESYSQVFTEPGDYPYYCTVHGTQTRGMVGKVVVKG